MVDEGSFFVPAGSDVALQRPSSSDPPLPPPFPASGFFTTTHHGPLGFISSGWPVAYLLATLIFGIGLIVAALVHVSGPTDVVQQSGRNAPSHSPSPIPNPSPKAPSVARITGMVDCVWEGAGGREQATTAANQKSEITNHKSLVHLGDRLAICSGLLELTYNTGARVILQGPVTYEVESPAGGFLSIGKLTAKLEQRSEVRGQKSESANQKSENRNQKFLVRTPTAMVTDLGTEFGVRVDKNGSTTSHVFRGTVKVQLPEAGVETRDNTVVLGENESVVTRRNPATAKTSFQLIRGKTDPRIFTRRMAPPIRSLDLRDLVAGGDGRPHRRLHEFRPSNAAEETVLVPEPGPCQKPRRLASADKLIDGIFVPDGSLGPVTLDSAGHRFAGFPPSSGKPFGAIDATAGSAASNNKGASTAGGLLGLRSDAGVTFDLQAVRGRYADVCPVRFHASAFCGASVGRIALLQADFQPETTEAEPRRAAAIPRPTIRSDGDWIPGEIHRGDSQSWWDNANPGHLANDASGNDCLRVQGETGVFFRGDTANQRVEVSFSIWKDSTKGEWSAVAGFVDQVEKSRTFTVYFRADGRLSYFDGDAMVDAGVTYQPNAWQDVTVRADMVAQTFTLTVGNATSKSLPWKYGGNAVSYLYFGNAPTSLGQFFVDNLSLTTTAGLAESQRRGFAKDGQGDLWVFVDGKLRLERRKLRPQDGAIPIDLEIGPDDRFLTLVGTGAENAGAPAWIIFRDPMLEMIPIDETKP
jgi:hypothetical protein